jgi:pimeloyl-ACP methyl ester carboxylesterase
MRAIMVGLGMLISLNALAGPPTPGPTLQPGAWEGALTVGAIKLRLVMHLVREADRWTATIDSVDQGATGIPVDEVKVEGATFSLKLGKLQASYEAKLDGNKLTGTWSQGPGKLPLELVRTDHPTAMKPKPQEPKPPLPYDAIDVTVDGPAGVKLAGTLTKPRGAGKFPAVVLITGSGPQDRDEALLGHRPFLVLADSLTRRGIAVLRCDDRGFAKSTGDRKKATTFDFVEDALAQVAFLRSRPEIDPTKIGLIGHSEGGIIAPIAAGRSNDVAFIVMLAGTGLPGEQITAMQQSLIAKTEGVSDATIRQIAEIQSKMVALAKSDSDPATLQKKARELLAGIPQAERDKMHFSDENVAQSVTLMSSPWFKTFLTLDPRPYLAKVKVPVLAIGGERDLQVPPKENLKEISTALKNNHDVTVRELPGLNHLFQHCKTGSPSEYAGIEETFAPAALDVVGEWIVKHTSAK